VANSNSAVDKCCGSPVRGRRNATGAVFEKVSGTTEAHKTPWGTEQQFVYCYCRLAVAPPR
jgi:hypothetical protein